MQNPQINRPNPAKGSRSEPPPPGALSRGVVPPSSDPPGALPPFMAANPPTGGGGGPLGSNTFPANPQGVTRPIPRPLQTMSSTLSDHFASLQVLQPKQVAPPLFSAHSRSAMQPYSAQGQGVPQPAAATSEAQPWQWKFPQNVPPPPILCVQPPSMHGMAPDLHNQQSVDTSSPATGPSGHVVSGPSKTNPSSSVLLHETRQSNQANSPPPATSEFIARDTGNCSPRYTRSTINQIPCTSEPLNTSGMQQALMVQPLALPHPSEEPIQIHCTFEPLNTSGMQLALLVQPLALPHPSEEPIQVVFRTCTLEIVPPPSVLGSVQSPTMYGMAPAPSILQSMDTSSPATGLSGHVVSVPSSSVLLHETRQSNQANPSSPATSEFIARDTGNCSPPYTRSTINQSPCTSKPLNTSERQLALTLALPDPSEEPIQPATSEFIARDTGNCSPRYMRSTINQSPCTFEPLTTSERQLALTLALPDPSEEPFQPATSEFIARVTGNCSPPYTGSTINEIPCTSDLLNTSGKQLALTLALPDPSEEPIQVDMPIDLAETECDPANCGGAGPSGATVSPRAGGSTKRLREVHFEPDPILDNPKRVKCIGQKDVGVEIPTDSGKGDQEDGSSVERDLLRQRVSELERERDLFRQRVSELERERVWDKECRRLSDKLFAVAEKDQASMKQSLDDKNADLSAMRAKVTKLKAKKIELQKCVSELRRDKKWVLEEGIPLIFDAIKHSDDYVDKLTDLTTANDTHGHSEGLAAGYKWAKKGEPLEKHPDYEANTFDKMETSNADFYGLKPDILIQISRVSEEQGLSGLHSLLLPKDAVAEDSDSEENGCSNRGEEERQV